MSEDVKLKPCPFCGQPPETWKTIDGRLVGTCYTKDCPANHSPQREGHSVKGWNTRSGEQAAYERGKQEERARIVEALKERRNKHQSNLKLTMPQTISKVREVDEAINIVNQTE
jgi:hypothetical protein